MTRSQFCPDVWLKIASVWPGFFRASADAIGVQIRRNVHGRDLTLLSFNCLHCSLSVPASSLPPPHTHTHTSWPLGENYITQEASLGCSSWMQWADLQPGFILSCQKRSRMLHRLMCWAQKSPAGSFCFVLFCFFNRAGSRFHDVWGLSRLFRWQKKMLVDDPQHVCELLVDLSAISLFISLKINLQIDDPSQSVFSLRFRKITTWTFLTSCWKKHDGKPVFREGSLLHQLFAAFPSCCSTKHKCWETVRLKKKPSSAWCSGGAWRISQRLSNFHNQILFLECNFLSGTSWFLMESLLF